MTLQALTQVEMNEIAKPLNEIIQQLMSVELRLDEEQVAWDLEHNSATSDDYQVNGELLKKRQKLDFFLTNVRGYRNHLANDINKNKDVRVFAQTKKDVEMAIDEYFKEYTNEFREYLN
jgi:hypothetical protein